jgi:hypothetical protein
MFLLSLAIANQVFIYKNLKKVRASKGEERSRTGKGVRKMINDTRTGKPIRIERGKLQYMVPTTATLSILVATLHF